VYTYQPIVELYVYVNTLGGPKLYTP